MHLQCRSERSLCCRQSCRMRSESDTVILRRYQTPHQHVVHTVSASLYAAGSGRISLVARDTVSPSYSFRVYRHSQREFWRFLFYTGDIHVHVFSPRKPFIAWYMLSRRVCLSLCLTSRIRPISKWLNQLTKQSTLNFTRDYYYGSSLARSSNLEDRETRWLLQPSPQPSLLAINHGCKKTTETLKKTLKR